jgi:hypothetical protein
MMSETIKERDEAYIGKIISALGDDADKRRIEVWLRDLIDDRDWWQESGKIFMSRLRDHETKIYRMTEPLKDGHDA